MRFGTVALVGRTNVGKSTFLNAALGEPLAIVSRLPQTTRDALLGVVHRPEAQIAFVDLPGLHRPRTELGRRMNATARGTARSTDVVVLMTDVTSLTATTREKAEKEPLLPEDVEHIKDIAPEATVICVVNKVDLLRDKSRLLHMLSALSELRTFAALVPISARSADGVERVLEEIEKLLPEGLAGYDEMTLTDRPTSFFVREYVREQVLNLTEGEVPHAVAVSVEEVSETAKVVIVKATIHVEKDGQRAILVGKGGAQIKELGIGARKRLEELLGRKVHIELFVRVTPRWKSMPRQLAELGYDRPTGGGGGGNSGGDGSGDRS
ncbi:MAG TPA: GTPase Era [Polyangiaceae bacterium]|jgi:GTP-binding protein Era|nr:GTPase Era [Polyangiaceae bacterium]